MRRIARAFPIRNRADVAVLGLGFIIGGLWSLVGLPIWPLYFLPLVLFAVLFVYFVWNR